MITEDYCSFELSSFLKEKGFDEPCYGIWHVDNKLFDVNYEPLDYSELREERLLAPTHQMAMKWLRKKSIRICIDYNNMSGDWYATIAKEYDGQMSERIRSEHFTLYEEAVDAAIKYALEKFEITQPERAH